MPKIRAWTGQTPKIVTGRLIRDTGTGLIVDDARGVRYFAWYRDVIEYGEPVSEDLFAPLVVDKRLLNS